MFFFFFECNDIFYYYILGDKILTFELYEKPRADSRHVLIFKIKYCLNNANTMDMSQEIMNRLEQYIYQEQALLNRLLQLKKQRADEGTEISKALISKGAGAVAKELFESPFIGRLGRKITKSALDQKQKEQHLIQERGIDSQHRSLVQSIRAFLCSISVKRKNLEGPNSDKQVAKLDRAQEFVKVVTRIKRTVLALRSIAKKPLIHNKDIPVRSIAKEVILSPGEPYTASRKIKEILEGTRGYVKIIDPYVDETTLDFLLSIPKGLPIKLLTAFTGGKDKERRFKRECKRFKAERPEFEIRKCNRKLIHDRFILTQAQGWSVGSSIKDIGKKLSMIKEISEKSKNEAEKKFDEIWKNAKDDLS